MTITDKQAMRADSTTEGSPMKTLFWKIRLAFWILVFGYGYRRTSVAGIFRFAFSDCWDSFREDGYTPREAIIEDASNA